MTRIDLPGGWAELCSPRKVQERKRRRYIAAVADLNASTADLPQVPNPNFGKPGQPATVPNTNAFGSKQMELTDRVGDMLILCLVREWSFGEVTEDALSTLDADQFDTLFKACQPLTADMMPDYSPDPDPKAPTGGSLPSPLTLSTDRSVSATLSSVATS